MKANKKDFLRALKFVLFSISAGLIQLAINYGLLFIWPVEKFVIGPALFYFIGLIASVIYNTTINRKFTFKSASNIKIAILKTLAFYALFAPASLLLEAWLSNGEVLYLFTIKHLGWNEMLGTLICMAINLLLEWPYQRFFVFNKTIDTNINEKKEK